MRYFNGSVVAVIRPLIAEIVFSTTPQLTVEYIGSWASVIGVPLSLLAIAYAIRESRKAKTASEAAKDAVQNFRRDLGLMSAVQNFAKALSISEEIKRLLHSGSVPLLPGRLSEMRQLLIAIRSGETSLTPTQRKTFQAAIVNFRKLETEIGGSLASGSVPLDLVAINGTIIHDVDALHEVLNQLQGQIGTSS